MQPQIKLDTFCLHFARLSFGASHARIPQNCSNAKNDKKEIKLDLNSHSTLSLGSSLCIVSSTAPVGNYPAYQFCVGQCCSQYAKLQIGTSRLMSNDYVRSQHACPMTYLQNTIVNLHVVLTVTIKVRCLNKSSNFISPSQPG